MATVNVSSWAEFAAAVQVAGDTVVCPENAAWDMNEIAPEGITFPTVYAAEIRGNGTTIKNLRATAPLVFDYAGAQAVNSLHIENFIVTSGEYFLRKSRIESVSDKSVQFNGCKISGLLPSTASALCMTNSSTQNIAAVYFSRCAIVVEFPTSSGGYLTINPTGGGFSYSRIRVYAPNYTGATYWQLEMQNASWCAIRLDCPQLERVSFGGCVACAIDGDLPALTTQVGTLGTSYISIFNADSAPNLPSSARLIGVTREQMYNPAYLNSIGFPIGVEE